MTPVEGLLLIPSKQVILRAITTFRGGLTLASHHILYFNQNLGLFPDTSKNRIIDTTKGKNLFTK